MSKVISVTSGKGGVGKSSFSCLLGRALAAKGKATVILELDCGLRGLDIMLGVSDSVYDFNDILHGRCSIKDAVNYVPDCKNLSLINAPSQFERFPTKEEVSAICSALKTKYDFVIIDTTAGYGLTDALATVSDTILLLVTPDPICVRDAAIVAAVLRKNKAAELRLIINKVSKEALKKDMVPDLDAVIDGVGVHLLGVVKDQQDIWYSTAKGLPLSTGSLSERTFQAIAKRLTGEHTPLVVQ